MQTGSASEFETLYAGYRWDGESPQLYYVRNRFLLPVMGTWNRRDPLGYVDGMGLYVYRSTINETDPDGRLTKCRCSRYNGRSIPPLDEYRFTASGLNCRAVCGCGDLEPLCSGTVVPLTKEESLVTDYCCGNSECIGCLSDLLDIVNRTYKIGSNRCFSYMDQVIQQIGWPNLSTTKKICGGLISLEAETWSYGRFVPTEPKPLIGWYGMWDHAVMKVTFQCGNKVAYFDIGANTWLGNIGGDDHWFFPDQYSKDACTGQIVKPITCGSYEIPGHPLD